MQWNNITPAVQMCTALDITLTCLSVTLPVPRLENQIAQRNDLYALSSTGSFQKLVLLSHYSALLRQDGFKVFWCQWASYQQYQGTSIRLMVHGEQLEPWPCMLELVHRVAQGLIPAHGTRQKWYGALGYWSWFTEPGQGSANSAAQSLHVRLSRGGMESLNLILISESGWRWHGDPELIPTYAAR